ncbi:MAG: acyl-CoA dehydrogenase, partial [Myxococcota bacterium]
VELGWSGITVPEAHGGYDMGPAAVSLVAAALGAHLGSSPFATTAVFGAQSLSAGLGQSASSAVQSALQAVVEGRSVVAAAIDEGPRHAGLEGVALTASPSPGGFVLTGTKRNVLDVPAADQILVAARTDGGTTAFLVPVNAAGLTTDTSVLLDVRRSSTLKFGGVEVSKDQVVGAVGQGDAVLGPALELARLAVAAETLGAASAVFEITLAYLRDRKQFGVPIGSFQALQHRAAHAYTELTIAQAAVGKAAQAVTVGEDAAAMVAVAKSKVGAVSIAVANEAIQMHGGVGVTDEFDVGLYVKRIRTLENLFGDRGYHADRYAKLRGF